MQKIEKGEYNFNGAEWNGVSKEAKNIINRMLTFDPKKRPSAEELLKDSWLN